MPLVSATHSSLIFYIRNSSQTDACGATCCSFNFLLRIVGQNYGIVFFFFFFRMYQIMHEKCEKRLRDCVKQMFYPGLLNDK